MKGLLLRVAIDQADGHYNAPINPKTYDYLYMPITEELEGRSGMQTTYKQIEPYFNKFAARNHSKIKFPKILKPYSHLDPDFKHLTYGDQEKGRGACVRRLEQGDFIAFFASFRPITPCAHKLIYALFGIFFVKEIVKAKDIPCDKWQNNAHTRIVKINDESIVVHADKSRSGRFRTAIPIGEYRDKAYRVKNDLLNKWGELETKNGHKIKNGYIQRSVSPPFFKSPNQFLKWLANPVLIANNWE